LNPPSEIRPSRAEQRAWYIYDFANSAFSSTVVTLFLGPYLTVLARAAAGADGRVYPFGIPVDARSYWGYLIALSIATKVFILPIVGAIADTSPRKKQLLGLSAYAGAAATMAMFVLTGDSYILGGALFLTANLAFSVSIVIYNSFLNDIAPASERDAVSSKGWGVGYLGGGVLLALNLLLYKNAAALGMSESFAVRISLCSAGVWWALFSVWPMLGLRNRPPVHTAGGGVLAAGFLQIAATVKGLRHYPQTLLFLLAYMLYNDGVQAVITLSGQYGADHLKIPMDAMTLAILMVQFVAFAGAMIFNLLARRLTAQRAIALALVLWVLVVGSMYWVRTTGQFFIAAAVVAVVMGGTQALSRSLYSLMIPRGKEAEYFSLYEVCDKGTSWLAPLLFALTLQFTGSYENAIASLIVFFAAGLAVLLKVDVARAAREAGNAP
jgi:UMF1 family MFS transporter